MPLNPVTGGLIVAGLGAASNAANMISQGSMNKKTRKWNENMYRQQRADSLADWAMQNEYNHPSSQMARLRDAGLNPNLVYGNGTETTAGPVRGTSADKWTPIAPTAQLGQVAADSIGASIDLQVKQAQVDNLRKQNTLIQNQAVESLARGIAVYTGIDKTKIDTEAAKFDLTMKEALRDTNIAITEGILKKQQVDTQFTINQDERARLMNAATLEKMVEEILTIQKGRAKTDAEIREIDARIKNLSTDQELKQLELELRKRGINPNDPTWLRMIIQGLSGVSIGTPGDGGPVQVLKKRLGIK